MPSKSQEVIFQNDIIQALANQGWEVGQNKHYDKQRALYPEDLIAYVKATHPQQWQKLSSFHKDPEEALLKAVVRDLENPNKGTLWVLRNKVVDRGAKFSLCAFKPDHDLNPDASDRYNQNILRVVPEVVYSPYADINDDDVQPDANKKTAKKWRIDLVLFINGLPIATLELKSEFKQSIENAKIQYMKDRLPKDPVTKKPEPLLTFKRGALVHFAVSQNNVAMTTKLDGHKTFFLPFDQGTSDGGSGNDINKTGYSTEYLWKEVFARDSLLTILGRYIHLQVKEEEQPSGKISRKETMIFPRYHQWSAVSSLLSAVEIEGTGQKYLIQHSAGSGKSNSIAWLSHQTASLHYHSDHPELNKKSGDKVFDSVIVITDRTVLDSQLQDTIYQFEHNEGMIARVNREDGQGAKSAQLAEALKSGTAIIIVTIQTFPFVLDAIREDTNLAGKSFAVIADEAHSSQTGTTARKLREVLMAEQLDKSDEELSSDDILRLTLEARKGSNKISYFAFTATPKGKTLELFGRPEKPDEPLSDDNKPHPFHVYSMRQAIEEGFILDVLQNYTSYNVAYKLAHKSPDSDEEVDSKKAASKLAKWVRLHPYNIAQKVEVIIEHFNNRIKYLLSGEAKAMVVTSSRLEAVRYKTAFEKYVKERGYEGINAMVAFSGEVNDPDIPDSAFTENGMNPGLKGRDMRKAFDTPDYQVMLVANKFQTGFDQPKLVAMYVDKPLKGVECIQTLSRLNRTYPGKDQTFVLDFVNDPQDVLKEFKVFFQTAELNTVSDPNLVYELKHKLDEARIYQWHEVEAFFKAYHDKKVGQGKLVSICKPAVERFKYRFKEASEVHKHAQKELRRAKAEGNEKAVNFADNSVVETKKARDELEVFRKDLMGFCRFYEFSSQIVNFEDDELEKLNLFAKELFPLLRVEVVNEEIPLEDVVMTHHKLHKRREQDLRLVAEKEKSYLNPVREGAGATPREKKTEFLREIIDRMNDLFAGENFTDGDMLSYANTIRNKVEENEEAMEQVNNNTKEQALLGAFPTAINKAVIDSMGIHSDMAMKVLSSKDASKRFAELMFDMLLKEK
ncbi:type I restriction endonuclease subunit R [Salinimonas iocasae]|uniref:Type I restriction endonuclease subunit R n=1 Tax=Salinimonas iocasae TaxID=2572577 RepID=A0A5B7YFF4_9ALTE|nr:DEAD/DEAH box helicase family protein [Salinimonas iocasae]QCZ94371.1 type I restriction endonuclease subunit R [Salinimonas iocasae]